MSVGRSVNEKISDWKVAYDAIAAELTPDAWNPLGLMTELQSEDAIQLGMNVSRIIMANNRAAAMVAALITQTGIKPVAFDATD